MPETFVGLAEAATRKGVHYQTVRRAITRGDLKAMKVGGGVIIALVDLEGWHPHYKNAPRRHRQEWPDGIGPAAASGPDGNHPAADVGADL